MLKQNRNLNQHIIIAHSNEYQKQYKYLPRIDIAPEKVGYFETGSYPAIVFATGEADLYLMHSSKMDIKQQTSTIKIAFFDEMYLVTSYEKLRGLKESLLMNKLCLVLEQKYPRMVFFPKFAMKHPTIQECDKAIALNTADIYDHASMD